MVDRDERTVAVENASYRWSYLLLSIGILAIVAGRSLVAGQQSWDLLALVVLGGVVNAGYQAAHGVVTKKWSVAVVLTVVMAGVAAVAMRVLQ